MIFLPLVKYLPAPTISHLGWALPVMGTLVKSFLMFVGILFYLLNWLMMSIKTFWALQFFCLISCCSCFFSLCFLSESTSFLSTMNHSEVNIFSESTLLSVMSSAVCFCSMLNNCNSSMSKVRTCKHYETFSLHFPLVIFDIGVKVCLFTTSTSELEFLVVSLTSKLPEETYYSRNVTDILFSSLFSIISHAEVLSWFYVMFIRSWSVG